MSLNTVSDIVENTGVKTMPAPYMGDSRPYTASTAQHPIASHPNYSHLPVPQTAARGHGTGHHVTSYGTNQNTGSFNMSSIQDVLKKTSEAVADLDRFMQNAANAKPQKI